MAPIMCRVWMLRRIVRVSGKGNHSRESVGVACHKVSMEEYSYHARRVQCRTAGRISLSSASN